MKPLEDIRIIALEQYGAGPFGSVHLADLGAEVIKIEDPASGGDIGRYVPPHQEDEDSLFFEVFNRNKRSLSVDLTTAAGRSVFEDLVRVSDVVYSNLRGDVPAKIGITYSDLKHLNERIVCCALTGFGMTGPRASEPGYDYILQGIAGWMDITGEPSGPPTKSGLSLVDYSGGLVAALSILVGVHAARRDGAGMDCDVSLFDTAIGMLTYPAIWALNGDFRPARTRHSAHPSLVPFQAFPAADGWLVVACPKKSSGHAWPRWSDARNSPPTAGSRTSWHAAATPTSCWRSSMMSSVRALWRNGLTPSGPQAFRAGRSTRYTTPCLTPRHLPAGWSSRRNTRGSARYARCAAPSALGTATRRTGGRPPGTRTPVTCCMICSATMPGESTSSTSAARSAG